MEGINYSNEMYKEDIKLVNSVYNKYFKLYKNCKDDLIAIGLFTAWKCRCNYNGQDKYSTYCCQSVFNNMLMEITRNKQYTEDYVLFSEEITSSKESKTTIADILEDKKFNIDDIDSCIVLQQLITNYLKELSKPNKIYRITLMILKGYSSKEIAEKTNCSITYVNRVKQEFKIKLKNLINKEFYSYDK